MYFSNSLYRPAQIILLRHAEKPPVGPELNKKGFQRAHMLPTFFISHPTLIEFGDPAVIIAAIPDRIGGSIRSIQTVIPLANHFQLEINENFPKAAETSLVAAIFSNPKWHNRTIVICWNRQGLPLLAHLLGAKAPSNWDKNCFDRFWVIRYIDNHVPLFIDFNQGSVLENNLLY
jgi:hypothetical protein